MSPRWLRPPREPASLVLHAVEVCDEKIDEGAHFRRHVFPVWPRDIDRQAGQIPVAENRNEASRYDVVVAPPDFAKSLGAPLALKDLGLKELQLDLAADLAVKNPYWNPRQIEREAVRALLQRAWEGAPPE